MFRLTRAIAVTMLSLAALLGMNVAAGQVAEGVIQTLDRTQVHSRAAVIEMDFAGLEDTDFLDTGIRAESAFAACKLTALDGLFCLDGKTIRNFPDTSDPSDSSALIDCEDPALGLDDKKPDTCTGLTVDLTGAIWIAGKNKGKSHSLIQAVAKEEGACPSADWTPLAGDFCALEYATGRPLLVDINPVDGDVAAGFPLGAGIIGLEERKTIVFFPAAFGADPVEIASGKQEIPLSGNEAILSAALWQSPDALENRILVITDRGRVLSVPISAGGQVGTITEVFDVPARRGMRGPSDPVAVQCNAADASYGIRTSAKSGLIYVTDRQFCEVLALVPEETAPFSLTEVQQPCPASDPACETTDLTLSTADASLGVFPPEAPTVAPGIGIDLRDCSGSCALVLADDGDTAFSLSFVEIESSESGLTLFQIKNIPDCRYVPAVCEDLLGVTDLIAAGVVVPLGVGNESNPAAQLLNITPLLPTEITDLFDASGMPPDGLPPMYVSRQYRGQKDRLDALGNPIPFTFEAFFGISEPGVVFRGVFEEFYDTAGLTGDELGCSDQSDTPPPTTLAELLQWDVVTTVSERYITFTDPVLTGIPGSIPPSGIGTPQYVDSMTNVACGSSKAAGQRWSIKPYNLETTPCTWNSGAPGEIWVSDGTCPLPPPANPETVVESPDDAVFAKLTLQLFDDLRDAQNQLACVDVDSGVAGLTPTPTDPPLSPTDCAALDADWLNARDKLDKCWDATQQPKQSAGDQNCQAFESQLGQYEAALAAATRFGPDPANRIGELRARLQVIQFVYYERLVPSIPADGYDEPASSP